jgi:pimeloyl-ACP methyl ester carboxylesterase
MMDLAFDEQGSGRPLVLLHAFPLSAAMWSDLDLPCRLVAPDQRGFGGSPLGEDAPSLQRCAQDVLALLDRLGLERVVLGGLSMGGYVAMELLRQAPHRVEALLLADTKAQADTPEQREGRLRTAETVERQGTGQLAETMLPALLGATSRERRPEVVTRVRGWVEQAPPATVAWASRAMAARPDSFAVLRATDVPALVVVGEQDVLSPVAQAQEMADALPQGRLALVRDAGHLSAVEDPEAFGAVVAAFLGELG